MKFAENKKPVKPLIFEPSCKKRIQGGSSSSPGTSDPVKKIDEDDDDALLEVYK